MAGMGGGAPRVNFVDQSVDATNAGAGASAAYTVNSNGTDAQTVNGVTSTLSAWVSPTTAGANYEVFATVSSGTLSSGTVGSWVATSTNPSWGRIQNSIGASFVNLTMQVRAVSTTTVLDTWTVALTAERTA